MSSGKLTAMWCAGAILLMAMAGPASALVYPSCGELARDQYLALRAALGAQGMPAAELLASGDMSMRGKVWELRGRLMSMLSGAGDDERHPHLFLLETTEGVTVALRSAEDLQGVALHEPIRVLALLPADLETDAFRLYGVVRETDLPPAPAAVVAPEPAPAPSPAEPAALAPTSPAPPPAPTAEGNPAPMREADWDWPEEALHGSAPYPNLPQIPMSQEGINQWKQWIRGYNKSHSDLQLELIVRWVVAYSIISGVDHRLSFAMIQAESNFNPVCVSHAGAMGMTQLMPFNLEPHGVDNPFNVQQNIRGGIAHLAEYLRRYEGKSNYEQTILGLAAYNAGPGAVRRHGGVPPFRETQNYVRKVGGKFHELVAAGYP